MSSTKGKGKSIEETYKKLTQREHILQRPDTYIGNIKKQMEELWVPVSTNEKTVMKKKMVEFSPGFLKIFDEILTNATDHSFRDQSVSTIKVDFNIDSGEISVWNNGEGIPVVIHKEHNLYVPELIFGHLLTGSNYDDSEDRIGAGRNGYGSKLSNIFSKKFIVETIDSKNGLKFIQEFRDNMDTKLPPKITKNSSKSYTKITFLPDYERFHMKGLEKDTVDLLKKRVYDCIACTNKNVTISLNGEKLKGKGLLDYTNYFIDDSSNIKMYHEVFTQTVKSNELIWEYIIVPNDHFEQVSFVNGNSTYQGGKHVDHIVYQIITKLKTLLETKKKLKDVKPAIIKERFFIFLRSTVINPSFSSQTKELLTTPVKDFGCRVEVPDKFIEKLWKSPIIEEIVEFCKMKESLDVAKKTDGSKKNKVYVPKLEDALWAGTAKSDQCTLILTEGLSAMTFALWGRSIVGPEKLAVFPLKGKCVSECTKIPLWNGETKYAKDIIIGDELIGDDGNIRNVLSVFKDRGKMYEIVQARGNSYKVNDEHILTLCMPEHKSIYWYEPHNSWRTLYWDKFEKRIKVIEKSIYVKEICNQCGITMNSRNLKIHYKKKHKNSTFLKQKTNLFDTIVVQARKELEERLLEIDDNNIIDISIKDFLKIPEGFKRKLKGIRGQCVNWEKKDIILDPYILGLWLGDGSSNGYSYTCNGKKDQEIVDYLTKWGENNDAKFTNNYRYTYNISSINNFKFPGFAPLKKLLSKYNLINNKHIPKEYLINSKDIRLKVLAGIIDTDGYVHKDGTIEICQCLDHKQLTDDIVYLSRSLGFYTYVTQRTVSYSYKGEKKETEAYRIKISGYTEEIPTLLPRKKCKSTNQYNMRNSTGTIQVKEIPDENYVGITIDQNQRFLINDFTITHNCLNIRDASMSQLVNNEEINNIKQIIGLKQGKDYKDTKELRYGKVMFLTDADVDGNHIKGLLINMFHYWWPSLLKLNFIETLRTPIIKAIRGKKVLEFYTEQDYHKWQSSLNNTNGYQIRYFKGLGTSKKEDAQDTFRRINDLRINYYYKDKLCDDAITLAFEKDKNVKKATIEATENGDISDTVENTETVVTSTSNKCSDKRKRWLAQYNRNSYIEATENKVSFQDFVHKELIHFSIYDNLRSIPSLCDGLKPSQRKILHYMLKNNINKTIKVAQLSGYVSAETGYHHGEASLQGAIVSMAQNFVGSNNINLLYPDGNFGTRLVSGKDAASPRYIFTRLSDITGLLFDKNDSPLLTYLKDDGIEIEPEWFLPVLPMVLINGCEGIGTGYSTYIPPYNPNDIVANLIRIMDDKDPLPMKPYFKNFHGELQELENSSYMTIGKWQRLSDAQIKITELPIGCGVTTYKEFLESFIEGNSKTNSNGSTNTKTSNTKTSNKTTKKKISLKDVQNKTRDENDDICFIVEFSKASDLDELVKTNTLEKTLRLTRSFTTNNMYLFSEDLILTKYKNATDILLDFYDLRLEFYEKRKEYLVKRLQNELLLLNSKIRFIEEYIGGSLDINKKSKEYILSLLEQRGYPKLKWNNDNKNNRNNDNKEGNSDSDDNESNVSFDYLIRMPIFSLSLEKIKELQNQRDNKKSELDTLQSKTEKDLWKEDLIKVSKYF